MKAFLRGAGVVLINLLLTIQTARIGALQRAVINLMTAIESQGRTLDRLMEKPGPPRPAMDFASPPDEPSGPGDADVEVPEDRFTLTDRGVAP